MNNKNKIVAKKLPMISKFKLMKYRVLIIFLLLISYSFKSKADSLNIAASTGVFDGDCYSNTDGTVKSAGSSCTFIYPILFPIGETTIVIDSVSLYFYDNSGSVSITGSFVEETLSSDSYSTIDTGSGSTTSSSVQTLSLSGDTLSSGYAYFVIVTLNYSTRLTGIRIDYTD